MSDKNIIPVTCQGSVSVCVDDLVDFQGELKIITEEQRKRLRASILEHGFSFPVFTWRGYILDGHQRLKVLRELIEEGYELDGDVPCVEVQATDKAQAARKLLAVLSQYGQVQHSGLQQFIDLHSITPDEIGLLSVPDVDVSTLMFGDGLDGFGSGEDLPDLSDESLPAGQDNAEQKFCECPQCGFKMPIKKGGRNG